MAGSLASVAKSKGPNRREWPRYQAAKACSLAATVEGHVMGCTVADISLGGARLVFDDVPPAGPAIQLSHPDARGVTCGCVWQNGREVGVVFDFSEDSLGLISICLRNMLEQGRQLDAAQ
jgi:PilZ domain